ncbi:MAG: type IV secretion system DNA-binding domain-containing protein [Desulfurococcaceae archaeon]
MIYRGSLLSSKQEIEGYRGDFLIGSCGNFLMAKYQPKLYKDLFKTKLYLNVRDFNKNTLVIGKMGSGKSNLLKYITAVFSQKNRFIIHDVKGEYVENFYEEGDVIFNMLDERGVLWDVLRDCKGDSMLARTVFYNMVSSYNKGEDAQFWTVKAVEVLQDMLSKISLTEPRDVAIQIFQYYRQRTEKATGETEKSALGTAQPVLQVLLDIYSLAHMSKKPLLRGEEILQRPKVFLVFLPEFSKSLLILNQGFLSFAFTKYLSRPDVRDFKDYTFFILDEYLSFNFEEELEKQVLTLARSKGMCLFLGMQFLPVDSKDRLSLFLNSRQFTFCFRVDAIETAKVLSESSGVLEYAVESISMGEKDTGLNPLEPLTGTGTVSVSQSRLQTFTVPPEVFLDLPDFVAYCEINTMKGKLKTFVKPVWYDMTARSRGFIRDENSKQLKSL